MTQIYISSTYTDLVDHRRHVYDILRKMRCDVIAMEDYVAADKRPVDQCLADVVACDVYVGIFAWRYGYIPPGHDKAITELEYRQAGQRGLERLIFLVDEGTPWPREYMDEVTGHGEDGARIKALRAELLENHMVQFFKTPEELAGQVATSVARWTQKQLDAQMKQLRARRDQADRERREMRERRRVVNLRPLDITHFKDRLREMRALCDHLADANVRLVSVVGRGGMGKTALASRVLADLERGLKTSEVLETSEVLRVDGILYLSAKSTGLGLERIYADVGRMLGEPAASQLAARWADKDMSLAAKAEYLLETLRDGVYIILLDNLEDYLTEEGNIAEEGLRLFIERCVTQPGGVRLIVTSREQVRLASAALSSARSIPLREGLPEDEAIALLRDLDPEGALGLRDAPEIDLRRAAQLTQRIPRALEILAGILHEDPTASLSRLLADEHLFGEQVVEQLVAEGYRRLGHDERRIMEALAVFDRPAEETAITYLLRPWFPGLDVRAGLHRLVSSYFAGANRVTGEYSLHPLDREYAYQQLPDDEPALSPVEGPEAYNRRNLELRAADFYAGIRKPESEWKSIDDLAPQLAEFEHRVRAEDHDGACRLLEPIDSDYLVRWGHYARLAEMREKLVGRLADLELHVTNLGNLGDMVRVLGQVEQAIKLHKEALTITRQIGDRQREAVVLGNLGLAYHDLGQVERAFKLHKEALTITLQIGDRWQECVQLSRLGFAYRARGDVKRAIMLHEESLAIARELGDRPMQASRLGRLGSSYRVLGQTERAIELFEEAFAIAHEIDDRRKAGVYLGNLGIGYQALGEVERATKLYEQALAIARQIGDRRRENIWLGNLSSAHRALGQVEQAIKLSEEALVITRQVGDRWEEASWLGNLGNAYYSLGRVERSIKLYQQALAVALDLGDRLGASYHLLGLGKALLAVGQTSNARRHCEEVLALEMSETSHQAALVLGIATLHQHDKGAVETFAGAAARSRAMLEKTSGLYEPRYTLATALVGTAVSDPRWAEEGERAGLLAPALTEYQRALETCDAPGVVRDALQDLELIRAAGIHGLEPVFGLLEPHAGEGTDVGNEG